MTAYSEAFGGWSALLPRERMDTALALADRARGEAQAGKTVYPPPDNAHIFRALKLTPPEALRCVVVGQDPYHEPGQACGLAFSVEPGSKIPRSLGNIFKELQADLGCEKPRGGDLTPWAERGVLLLNTVLTVEAGKANSHVGWGWQDFTRGVLGAACALRQPVVFLLWGAQAQKFCGDILRESADKRFLLSNHPSPLSAARGPVPFLGSRPFSRANELLCAMGAEPVDWRL